MAAATEPDRKPCAGRVFDGFGVSGWPCSRAGRVERDGRWYCKMHDPVAKRERSEARTAKLRAERDAYEAAIAVAEARARELGT